MFKDLNDIKNEILETISKLNSYIPEHTSQDAVHITAAIKNLSDAYAQLDLVEVMHIGK